MSGLQFDNIVFPDRKQIVQNNTHLDNVIDQAKNIDVNKVNFEGEDFQPHVKIIQKQKVYLWMRLYIKDEIEISPETKIVMSYLDGKEKLETYFMYYGKKGLERNKDGQIVNFDPEDDRKCLCLLIDANKIDYDNEDIPYMKTLFPLGKHFVPQYVKKIDYSFDLEDGTNIDFYDISF